jgi:hypothetical protein
MKVHPAMVPLYRLTAVALGWAWALGGCARLVSETRLDARPLEAPRKAGEVRLAARLLVSGVRDGAVVRAEAWDEQRCGDDYRQRVRGTRRTVTVAQGQSLTAEWLLGGLITLLGGTGVAWTVTHPAGPDEAPDRQSTRMTLTAAVAAGGLALLGAATAQQLQVGTHTEDLGERELRKVMAERPCGRHPRGGEALRLTLSDGTQLEAQTAADGCAVFELPAGTDERLQAEGRLRAVLEARSDPRAQVVVAM